MIQHHFVLTGMYPEVRPRPGGANKGEPHLVFHLVVASAVGLFNFALKETGGTSRTLALLAIGGEPYTVGTSHGQHVLLLVHLYHHDITRPLNVAGWQDLDFDSVSAHAS